MLANLLVILSGVLVFFLALILLSWKSTRSTMREIFSRPLLRTWADGPRPLLGRAAELDAEWRALGFVPIGTLLAAENATQAFQLYVRGDEPAYAGVHLAQVNGRMTGHPYLLTFFKGGGKLTTSSTVAVGGAVAAIATTAPRLVQVRKGASPRELEQQHLLAQREWIAAGRIPLPATKEALIGYAVADHAALREGVAASGWMPLGTFLSLLSGTPRGAVRF